MNCRKKDRLNDFLNQLKYQAAFLIDFEAEPGIFLQNDQRDDSGFYIPRPISWLMLDEETGKPKTPDSYFRKFSNVIEVGIWKKGFEVTYPFASKPSQKYEISGEELHI